MEGTRIQVKPLKGKHALQLARAFSRTLGGTQELKKLFEDVDFSIFGVPTDTSKLHGEADALNKQLEKGEIDKDEHERRMEPLLGEIQRLEELRAKIAAKQTETGVRIVGYMVQNLLDKGTDDIMEFLGSITGLTARQVEELPLDEFFQLVKQLREEKTLGTFFASLSGLLSTPATGTTASS